MHIQMRRSCYEPRLCYTWRTCNPIKKTRESAASFSCLIPKDKNMAEEDEKDPQETKESIHMNPSKTDANDRPMALLQ